MIAERLNQFEMRGVRKVRFLASPTSHHHSRDLRTRVLKEAEFREDFPNFVVLPFANRVDRPEFDRHAQRLTARLLLEAFRGDAPNNVVGIGKSGLELARAVNRELLAKGNTPVFVEAKNLVDLEEAQYPKDGFIFTAHSYSRQEPIKFHLPHLESGKTALVIDDVLAKGGISQEVLRQLLAMGVDVRGFGVYFSKLWEGGVQQIVNEFGIPVVAAIAIAGKDGDKITLVGEADSLVRYERESTDKWWQPDVTPVRYPTTPLEDAPPRKS